MQPLFFDGEAARLYGCFHPARRPAREVGIVLAAPQGHEAIRFHRAFLQLARLLAAAGFPVLRFDFSGCGDSGGGPELWSLSTWRGDLERAREELGRLASVPRVGFVGLRLGATLACLAADTQTSALVLWDPVVRGADYLRELRASHRAMLGYAHVLSRRDASHGEEQLGFPMPPEFARELAELRIDEVPLSTSTKRLLVESHPAPAPTGFVEHLARAGSLERRTFANPHLWSWSEDFARVHVPIEILQAIVAGIRDGA